MKTSGFLDKITVWKNIYKRIHYFREMYPLSSIIKDAFLFPVDYLFAEKKIKTIRNITFFITHKCNIRCKMCYFKEGLKNTKEIPLPVFKEVIDQVKHTKTSIQFGGGEPFTHPDLLEMIRYTKEAGLPVQIFTNGILVTKDIADQIVQMNADYINFTLLGNETTHSEVTNVAGSYQKFITNLEYISSKRGKTRVILNYTFSPYSYKDYTHAFYIADRLKLDGLRFQHYMYLLPEEIELQSKVMKKIFDKDIKSITEQCECDVSEMIEALIQIKERVKTDYPNLNVQWAPMLTENEIRNWYSGEKFITSRKCLYPWRGIHIDADGRIYPCTKIYFEIDKIEGNNVIDSWNNQNMKSFRKNLKRSLFPACSRCCKL